VQGGSAPLLSLTLINIKEHIMTDYPIYCVDTYIKEEHFEDCKVPESACQVDYEQVYTPNEPITIKEENNENIRNIKL
jgi:hypothetical protein